MGIVHVKKLRRKKEMNKKIISLILALVVALSSCVAVMAASAAASVSVNLTIGVGESKSLDTYLKEGASVSKWINSSSNVVSITKNTVKGLKEGSAVIKGTGNGVNYVFNVKVLKNFTGYQDLENKTNKNTTKNSRGETVTHKERYITMGVKDTVSIANMLDENVKYFNCNWFYSDKGIITFKGGKITAQKKGIVHVRGTNGKTIYDFFITVADNQVAKNITVRKETLTNLGKYLGDTVGNYVFKATSVKGASVSVKDDQYIASGASNGTSILTAESTTGGTSYTFIVTITG